MRRRAWALGLVGLLASGCREELGPEPMTTTRVEGVIRDGPLPVGGGWVEFLPVEGTVGLPCSAPLAADGTFRAERVPVGRVLITVAHPPRGLPGAGLFERLPLGIRREIPASGGRLELDRLAEAARLRRHDGPRSGMVGS